MQLRRVFYFDDFLIAFVSAPIYGISFLFADFFGWPELACLVFCFAIGLPAEMLVEYIIHRMFVQKTRVRKIITIVIILLFYFTCNSFALSFFGNDLESDLMEEFVWVVSFALLGFLTPVVRRIIHRRRYEKLSEESKKFKENDKSLVARFANIERLNRKLTQQDISGPTVKVENGVFVGSTRKGADSFLGIPYATQPVGALRWKAPVPPKPSNEVWEACFYGQCSYQDPAETNLMNLCPTGEECLNLNVWRPAKRARKRTGKLPVLVVFVSGAECDCGSASPLFSGEYFVGKSKNCIFVSVDCRFGPLGALDFSEVPGGSEYPDASRLCFLDAIEALRWIHRNIEAFGGDKNEITLAGTNYCGSMIEMLCVAQEAKGLFKRVLAVDAWFGRWIDSGVLKAQTKDVMVYKGLKTMDDFCALTRDDFIDIIEHFRESPFLCAPSSLLGETDMWALYRQGAASDIELLLVNSRDQIGLMRGALHVDFDAYLERTYFSNLEVMDVDTMQQVSAMYQLLVNNGADPTDAKQELVQSTMVASLNFALAVDQRLAGGTVRMMDWSCGAVSTDFGANEQTFLMAAFMHDKALAAYAAYVDDVVSDITECMVNKYICTGDPSISRGDVANLNAIEWPAFDILSYPILCFTDSTIAIERNRIAVQSLILGFVSKEDVTEFFDIRGSGENESAQAEGI